MQSSIWVAIIGVLYLRYWSIRENARILSILNIIIITGWYKFWDKIMILIKFS